MKKCAQSPSQTKIAFNDQTRTKILKAAAKHFAEKGFSGTSLSAIAKTAKITQSLIHHHFTNKENLWQEVKHTFCAQYDEKLKPTIELCPKNLKTFLHNIITSNFELFTRYPQALRMKCWQRLEQHNNQKKLQIDPQYNKYLQTMKKDILLFQKQGEIKQSIEPEFIMLLIGSMTQSIFDLNWYYNCPDLQQKQQEYIKFIINCIYQAIKA